MTRTILHGAEAAGPALLRVVAAAALAASLGCRQDAAAVDPSPDPGMPAPGTIEIEAEYATAALANDPDDPAVWVNHRDPARSLILGTMKVAAPAGALVAFGLDGQIRQTIFAIVSPKEGSTGNYLWQYRLSAGRGTVAAALVRRFGRFSGSTDEDENEIEAVAVDDALGYVYYADERGGIHKWHADPDHPAAAGELAVFATAGFRGDREGIGIYARPDGTGYIVCTDQLDGASEYRVFKREGEPGNPHDHSGTVAALRGEADSTDGIEAVASNLGPALPAGALVVMNSAARNFLVFRWQDLADAAPALAETAPATSR